MAGLGQRLGHPVVVRGAQLAIGAIFIVAGLAKIGDPRSFAMQIHNFRMTPIPLENLIAMTLPWIEVVAGLALILRQQVPAASRLILGLMVLFTVAVAQAVARGLDIECGCFGTADASTVGFKKLAENGGMILLAWLATLRPGLLASAAIASDARRRRVPARQETTG